MYNVEKTLESTKDLLIDKIYDFFNTYSKKDELGDSCIKVKDITDESLYVLGSFAPEWCESVGFRICPAYEVIEFWDNMGEIDVRTIEKGSVHLWDLEIDDLARCCKYLQMLDEKNPHSII